MREKQFADPDHRWDGDTKGSGVADATWLLHGASEMLEAMGRSDWVAEDAEAHLLPHLEEWCGRPESRLRVLRTMTAPSGCFEVALEWSGEAGNLRAVRAECFGLAGSVAESGTYIRQRLPPGAKDADQGAAGQEFMFELATGMLDADTHFASHGHTLRLRVLRVFG